jgi:RNA polymerase sigma-70 factor (ECF subfamily)
VRVYGVTCVAVEDAHSIRTCMRHHERSDLARTGVQAHVLVPSEFDRFVREHQRALRGLLYAVTGSSQDADDLAQEAFARAYKSWTSVGQLDRPDAWIRRVGLNLAYSRGRRLKVELRARARSWSSDSVGDSTTSVEYIGFWEEVRRLPKRQGQVLALRYVEDMSIREISALLGIAEGTVKALSSQACARLADRLRRRGWIDS